MSVQPEQSKRGSTDAIQRAAGHNPYAVWRDSSYRLYSASWLALVLASQIETVAVGMHIYDKTRDALALGWIGLARALPVIALALVGGQLADRFNRKTILLCTLTLGALSTLGLTLLAVYHAPVGWFYLFLFLGSIGQALGSPARSAILAQLVPSSIFSDAMAWNSSIFQVGSMIGPAVGGLLLGSANFTPPAFGVALGLRAISIGTVVFLTLQPVAWKPQPVTIQSLLEGARFVWNTRIILATITLDLFAVLVGGATYLLPLYAEDILHVGGLGLGWLRTAEAVGAIGMAMALAHLPPLRRAGRAMLWAVAGFGVATILFGLSRSFWLSMLAMLLIGACDNISVIVRHTLVQVLTPDAMRGRVSAINNIFIVASNDLGGFESAVAARGFGALAGGAGWAQNNLQARITGATASVVFGGVGAIAAVLGCAWVWPEVRSIGSLRDIKPAEEAAVQTEAAREETERA